MTNHNKKIVAVLSDLMFTVKIQEAAKRAGLESVFVKTREAALAQAQNQPAVIILDLNDSHAEPLRLIEELKNSEATREVQLLGYVSHVQVDLKRSAEDKGCDKVVVRSAFSQNLPALLQCYVED